MRVDDGEAERLLAESIARKEAMGIVEKRLDFLLDKMQLCGLYNARHPRYEGDFFFIPSLFHNDYVFNPCGSKSLAAHNEDLPFQEKVINNLARLKSEKVLLKSAAKGDKKIVVSYSGAKFPNNCLIVIGKKPDHIETCIVENISSASTSCQHSREFYLYKPLRWDHPIGAIVQITKPIQVTPDDYYKDEENCKEAVIKEFNESEKRDGRRGDFDPFYHDDENPVVDNFDDIKKKAQKYKRKLRSERNQLYSLDGMKPEDFLRVFRTKVVNWRFFFKRMKLLEMAEEADAQVVDSTD